MAASKPVVSIVTPTKNRRAMLLEAIASVQAQTFADWEHIIVDDGSDDGSAEAVAALNDPRIRFIRRDRETSGANVCRNIGVRESRGRYLVFLDSDDLLEPGCLARRVEILDRNADVDFITFQTGIFVERIGDQGRQHDYDLFGDDLMRFLLFEVPWIITAPLWRKEALVKIGLFDEALPSWQDVELHVRALTAGLRYLRFDEVDHHVRWQNNVGRISVDQRRSPRHLDAAIGTIAKYERMVREGPGMNWSRQRALCGLYFGVASLWLQAGDTKKALQTWRIVRQRGLGSRFLHLCGAVLLALKGAGLPIDRVIGKWQGQVRFRTNAELVPAR
jgi:glycosyltransferase involved in cell wall biosynthesis